MLLQKVFIKVKLLKREWKILGGESKNSETKIKNDSEKITVEQTNYSAIDY